ncbi:hypothetical protein [Mycoplasma mycoides]|uniref:hypothetical protein n=1 Tax=Mycoplasma mycoides TaxID=2102 RepID=UPI00223F6070|nr:hypothetical protein [Mycoplasma mycoides]QVJ96025.1 hypothetical protein I7632_03255 [Mycoplasma mycoides subsp. capri]QVJ96919.1 hypothetical protein I7633_03210 [Mycoplasma mycoides subsp. capri]QVK00782.1 hypothetical protein I7635_03205 [Mycoplasma mycoides subsp. capri]
MINSNIQSLINTQIKNVFQNHSLTEEQKQIIENYKYIMLNPLEAKDFINQITNYFEDLDFYNWILDDMLLFDLWQIKNEIIEFATDKNIDISWIRDDLKWWEDTDDSNLFFAYPNLGSIINYIPPNRYDSKDMSYFELIYYLEPFKKATVVDIYELIEQYKYKVLSYDLYTLVQNYQQNKININD